MQYKKNQMIMVNSKAVIKYNYIKSKYIFIKISYKEFNKYLNTINGEIDFYKDILP